MTITLFQFDITDFLSLTAVVTLHHAFLLVYVEQGMHWLVVGDAHRVGTFHHIHERIRQGNLPLFHHLIVANHGKFHVRTHHSQPAEFVIREELARNLDDTFPVKLLAFKVVANRNRFGTLVKLQHLNQSEEFVNWYVVDD